MKIQIQQKGIAKWIPVRKMGIYERQAIRIKMAYPATYDITVQSGYTENGEFIVEECNHAGADAEKETTEYIDHEGNLLTSQTEEILTCDKCGAYYDNSYGSWEL